MEHTEREIHGNLCLDEANRLCDEGHNVYLLDCDESIEDAILIGALISGNVNLVY